MQEFAERLAEIGWDGILGQWDAIETDFQKFYHLDLDQCLPDRSWRWFRVRVVRLLSEDTALARQLGLRDFFEVPDSPLQSAI